MPKGVKKIRKRTYLPILEVWQLFLWDFWLACIGLFTSFSGEVRNLKQQVFDLKSNFLYFIPQSEHTERKILAKHQAGSSSCAYICQFWWGTHHFQFITLESNARIFSIEDYDVNMTLVTFKIKKRRGWAISALLQQDKKKDESLVIFG